MKQSVQDSKVIRTISGRFLAVAVLAASAFTFTPRAQADPSQGAVVTHIDRDLTGWFYAVSSDGQLRLDVVTFGQGDFLRLNPDGTLTLEVVEPKAAMTIRVSDGNGGWVPMWVGSGSLHDNFLVMRETDGSLSSTGEDDHMHVEGKFTNVLDGSQWTLQVVVAIVDYELKQLQIDLQPR
jgi:hypothetical protein